MLRLWLVAMRVGRPFRAAASPPESLVANYRHPGLTNRSAQRPASPGGFGQVRLRHVAKRLDVVSERLFRFVRQLGKCIERNVTCDFKPDQGLNVSLLRLA